MLLMLAALAPLGVVFLHTVAIYLFLIVCLTLAGRRAMAELLRLEIVGAGLPPAKSDGPATVNLEPLLRFVLSDDDYLRYKAEQKQALQDGLDWMNSP